MPHQKNYNSEAGNVFLIILIGIVLFAALSFTIARGFRSETTNNLTDREATLAASEILAYAQRLERTINRLRGAGCSENELNFDNQVESGYTNPNAPADGKCNVFSSEGGTIPYWDTEQSNLHVDGSSYGKLWITGHVMHHPDAGETQTPDLIMMISNIHANLCTTVNKQLGITNPSDAPPDGTAEVRGGVNFTGTFGIAPAPDNREIKAAGGELEKHMTGCFEINSGAGSIFAFYAVLIQR